MFEHQLGQTLVVHPDVSFAEIERTMQRCGWQPETSTQSESLVAGEPEHRCWTWQGGKPFAVYTFNPVAKLRVLDVATLPPWQRGQLANELRLVDDKTLNGFFDSPDPRRRLLAIWATKECERLDFAPQVQGLRNDAESVVRQQSEAVARHLTDVGDRRVQVLGSLRLIASAAEKLVRQIHSRPDLVPALQPALQDCEALFDPRYAAAIHRDMQAIFAKPPNLQPGEKYRHLEITAAYAGLLRWPNELSAHFPRAYRDLAGWLQPDKVWLAWAWAEPLPKEKLLPLARSRSAARISYDGLVWLHDHWVWFPKLHRVMGPYLATAETPASVH